MKNKIKQVEADTNLISYVEKGVIPLWAGVILISIYVIAILFPFIILIIRIIILG